MRPNSSFVSQMNVSSIALPIETSSGTSYNAFAKNFKKSKRALTTAASVTKNQPLRT
jgi:hypothetical protein